MKNNDVIITKFDPYLLSIHYSDIRELCGISFEGIRANSPLPPSVPSIQRHASASSEFLLERQGEALLSLLKEIAMHLLETDPPCDEGH